MNRSEHRAARFTKTGRRQAADVARHNPGHRIDIDTPEALDQLPFRTIIREEFTSLAGWKHDVIWRRYSGPGSTAEESTHWTPIAAPLDPWEGDKPRNYPVSVLWTPSAVITAYEGDAPVNTCQHCHQPIMEFTFANGPEWWHTPTDGNNQTRRKCRDGQHEAQPRDDDQ